MPLIRCPEKFLLVVALLALPLAWGWTWRERSGIVRAALGKPAWSITSSGYQPSGSGVAEAAPAYWAHPVSQARGEEWVYDTFTPPEIFYDPRLREFSVTPPQEPESEPGVEAGPAPVDARPNPFRLQLVGFMGGEGHYVGAFENLATTEHILARGGRTLPELAVTIRDFHVTRVRRESADSMAASELIATAVVRDDRTGEDVVLTNREQVYLRP